MKNALEILEVEKIENKKELKIAYAKMLKKYHPEDYPEKFIEIQEAYKYLLENIDFIESKNSFKNKNLENIEIINSNSQNDINKDSLWWNEIEEMGSYNTDEIVVIDKNKINDWINKFYDFAKKEKRELEKWKQLLIDLNVEFNEKEKIIIGNNVIGNEVIYRNLTEIERNILLYNLKVFSQNSEFYEIVENLNANNEYGNETFIEKFFGIKKYKLWFKKFFLYKHEKVTTSEIKERVSDYYSLNLKEEFKIIMEYMKIFGLQENKRIKNKIYILFNKIFFTIFLLTHILLIYIQDYSIFNLRLMSLKNGIILILYILIEYIFIKKRNDFEFEEKSDSLENNFIIVGANFLFCILLGSNGKYFSMDGVLGVFLTIFMIIIILLKEICFAKIKYNKIKKFIKKIKENTINFD